MTNETPAWYEEGISKCCNAVIDGGKCSSCGEAAIADDADDEPDPYREIARVNTLAALAEYPHVFQL